MVKLAVAVHKRLGDFQLAVDFAVEGGLIVLFGPSGCGKSSTLAAIAGLLQPDRGRIALGEEVFCDSERNIHIAPQRRRLGFVFQNYALFPHLNVERNICFAIDRESRDFQRERLRELLTLLRLENLAHRYPAELSGGQQQRVALARALAPHPRLLLLDEPFSALDSELREELRDELKRLQIELALPVVMVTHTRSEALQLADTVVRLDLGQVMAVGSAAAVLSPTPRTGNNARFSW
ncbi:ABC transporter ATP-binding protein [Gloeobacter morelensis]|uniref:ATP-binding cassette domain-containing protein n=1 Tax=Gloeobacter morelensis MG652769 TaxID=2781736 RepID=A0ABY3PJX2_9CYAN|nr:ATP-binding cassette domain-containing protein [Gloeobacter morelensis]UFP93976.1 ATP-binding cassette domain-containing protein [Gloeobacter morelensis MG652769]